MRIPVEKRETDSVTADGGGRIKGRTRRESAARTGHESRPFNLSGLSFSLFDRIVAATSHRLTARRRPTISPRIWSSASILEFLQASCPFR